MKTVIFAFGDSITYGASDLELGGWANRLRLFFDEEMERNENLEVHFYNLGIPGETTEGFVKRLQSEVEARLRPDFQSTFIFAYGANDSAFLPEQKKFAVEANKFAGNLNKTITEAKKYSSKVVLLNITPVVEELAETPRENKKARLNKYIEQYNQKVKEVTQLNSISFVDIYSEFIKQDYKKLLSEDGLHPSTEGHKLIFEMTKGFLENWK
mgnify:CR=1 FL=1